jgi:hypothetical protein
LGIRIGSKEPSRSRGTSMRSAPSSVSTVSALQPLRWSAAGSGLLDPGGVAQVVAHLGAQGAFDQGLFERHRGGVDRLRAHRAAHKLVNELLRNRRQRRLGGRSRLHLAWHTCSFSTSTWYASHTNFRTGSGAIGARSCAWHAPRARRRGKVSPSLTPRVKDSHCAGRLAGGHDHLPDPSSPGPRAMPASASSTMLPARSPPRVRRWRISTRAHAAGAVPTSRVPRRRRRPPARGAAGRR